MSHSWSIQLRSTTIIVPLSRLLATTGGFRHGASEACFEAKGSQDYLPVRSGWSLLGGGGRRVRSCADNRCAVAGRCAASSNHPRRGGNLRRQPGDVLRLRQGKRPLRSKPAACGTRLRTLRRLQGLRGAGLQRLRGLRGASLQRLRGLRLPRLCRRDQILRRLCGLRRRMRILLDMARLCPYFRLLKPVGASGARARDRRRRSDSRRIASARAARSSGEKVPADLMTGDHRTGFPLQDSSDIAQFAPNFSVYVLPPDVVCLYSEDRKFFLHGGLFCALASAIGRGGQQLS